MTRRNPPYLSDVAEPRLLRLQHVVPDSRPGNFHDLSALHANADSVSAVAAQLIPRSGCRDADELAGASGRGAAAPAKWPC